MATKFSPGKLCTAPRTVAGLTVVAVKLFSSSLVKLEKDIALGFPHS